MPRPPSRPWWRLLDLNRHTKRFLRTAQTQFPGLLDVKFNTMRLIRNTMRIPFENDFNALSLFSDAGDAVFLDVGANRGQSADAILMNCKNARIHAFEPNPLLVEKLRAMFGRDERVTIHAYGLGDETTENTLVIPCYKKWVFDGLGSFERSEASDWLKPRMFFYKDRHLTLREWQCPIKRLDDLGLAPWFIKLDIQGYEYRALLGARQTICQHRPLLLIESPNAETIAFLTGLGYEYYAFKRGIFMPRVIGAPNTFFMTEETVRQVRSYIR